MQSMQRSLHVGILVLKRCDLPNDGKVPSAWWAQLHSRHQHLSVEHNVRPQEKALLRRIAPETVAFREQVLGRQESRRNNSKLQSFSQPVMTKPNKPSLRDSAELRVQNWSR
jgi:hypothetical protein